jgi:type VI secretion system protein VasG
VLELDCLLAHRVLGQPHAVASVARSVQTSRAGLDDPDKPRAVFLFVGPSGTGKTETALALADLLYGGKRKLIAINLSEYQEAHSVSGLKGSPPGYVGYGEGGVLTEAVRRNPYSVVLLDEIEKAHPDVLELFYQVFDKGVLDDAEGRQIDFRNTVIIATSNVASAVTMQACLPGTAPEPAELAELLRPHLVRQFKPAFLARMHVVPFYPIGDDALGRIIELKLSQVAQRVQAHHGAALSYDDKLVDAIYSLCTDADAGARNIDHVINGRLLPAIAQAVLVHMADGLAISNIGLAVRADGEFAYTIA